MGDDTDAAYISAIIAAMHTGADEGICHVWEIQVAFA